MKVTIITVCYNSEAYIERCLTSVAEQSYPNVEHIIIDGASKDATVEIARQFPHIASITSEPDAGIFDAMNKGLARATGDYLLFLNSDDTLFEKTTIGNVVQAMAKAPDADVYYGSLEVWPLKQEPFVFTPPDPSEAAEFMVTGCLPHQSTLAHKRVFAKTGKFVEKYHNHAEYDWFTKVLADQSISVKRLPMTIGSFREGGISSDLAKAQPEVFVIQNKSSLYASPAWDKRRIELFQQAWLQQRIEVDRLKKEIEFGKIGRVSMSSPFHALRAGALGKLAIHAKKLLFRLKCQARLPP